MQPEEGPDPTPTQELAVSAAGLDLAGVPTPPFSAALLAGTVTLPLTTDCMHHTPTQLSNCC